APATATVQQNQATAISGVSLSETGNTAGETFTVTLSDTNGDLSAIGPGVSGAGTTSLTITGSLSQVNSDLATLTDTDAAAASDTIAITASDSFGNTASQQPIVVTVTTLTTLVAFNGTNGADPFGDLIVDAAGNLFGTTEEGGAYNAGTVFEIAKTGSGYASTPNTLASFDGINGAYPGAGLTADAAGDFFGTTNQGGAPGNAGTVFELVNNGGGSYTLATLV